MSQRKKPTDLKITQDVPEEFKKHAGEGIEKLGPGAFGYPGEDFELDQGTLLEEHGFEPETLNQYKHVFS